MALRRKPIRIALTGGPGGGKTTALDMIAREFPHRVVALKETATILFEGGFPRSGGSAARRAVQRAIYRTQVELEEAVAAEHPQRILLCDRGTPDGCVYWPDGPDEFFAALGTTPAGELARYFGVLFFESAAKGGIEVGGIGNRFRLETTEEAAKLDEALRGVWSEHPRFRLIRHDRSFFGKVSRAIEAFAAMLEEIDRGAAIPNGEPAAAPPPRKKEDPR